MKIIPNVPPKIFTLSAITVGYLLIDDTTANEQNALGNWLMLTAQVLCTNAFYKQVQAERKNDNLNSFISQNKNESKNQKQSNYNEYGVNDNNYHLSQSFFYKNAPHNMNPDYLNNINTDNINSDTIEMLQKMVDAIQKEINELKK